MTFCVCERKNATATRPYPVCTRTLVSWRRKNKHHTPTNTDSEQPVHTHTHISSFHNEVYHFLDEGSGYVGMSEVILFPFTHTHTHTHTQFALFSLLAISATTTSKTARQMKQQQASKEVEALSAAKVAQAKEILPEAEVKEVKAVEEAKVEAVSEEKAAATEKTIGDLHLHLNVGAGAKASDDILRTVSRASNEINAAVEKAVQSKKDAATADRLAASLSGEPVKAKVAAAKTDSVKIVTKPVVAMAKVEAKQAKEEVKEAAKPEVKAAEQPAEAKKAPSSFSLTVLAVPVMALASLLVATRYRGTGVLPEFVEVCTQRTARKYTHTRTRAGHDGQRSAPVLRQRHHRPRQRLHERICALDVRLCVKKPLFFRQPLPVCQGRKWVSGGKRRME